MIHNQKQEEDPSYAKNPPKEKRDSFIFSAIYSTNELNVPKDNCICKGSNSGTPSSSSHHLLKSKSFLKAPIFNARKISTSNSSRDDLVKLDKELS